MHLLHQSKIWRRNIEVYRGLTIKTGQKCIFFFNLKTACIVREFSGLDIHVCTIKVLKKMQNTRKVSTYQLPRARHNLKSVNIVLKEPDAEYHHGSCRPFSTAIKTSSAFYKTDGCGPIGFLPSPGLDPQATSLGSMNKQPSKAFFSILTSSLI